MLHSSRRCFACCIFSEFGAMVGYPLHTSFLLARAFPTDMLLSRKGLRLTPSGKHATATAALSIRYVSFQGFMQPSTFRQSSSASSLRFEPPQQVLYGPAIRVPSLPLTHGRLPQR